MSSKVAALKTRKNSKDKVQASSRGASARVQHLPAPPQAFIDQFFANLLPDDLAALSEAERKRLAASMWQLAQKRVKGAINLRVFNPDVATDGWSVDHTVLETINDDMPFLLDSVVGALQKRGLTVHLSIHPVMRVLRDGRGLLAGLATEKTSGDALCESMMHIHFDRCLDSQVMDEIAQEIRDILRDVRASVEDWSKMRQATAKVVEEMAASQASVLSAEDVEEGRRFLQWLNDRNYTFLGYQVLDLSRQGPSTRWKIVEKTGLGILRENENHLFGNLLDGGALAKDLLPLTQKGHHIVVVKANENSRVHRAVPMDAIMIQRYDAKGNIIGHHLFVGLFTANAYAQSTVEIPLLQHKINDVIRRASFDPLSHNGRSLMHILDTYPRDELFQIDTETLYDHTLGIVQLQDRARVSLFTRREMFGRFVSCIVYVPRDRYDALVGSRIHDYLQKALNGTITNQNVRIGDSALARLFMTIKVDPAAKLPARVAMEADLRELCRAWPDRLRDALLPLYGEAETLRLLKRYEKAFPEAYRALSSVAQAVQDIATIERRDSQQPFVVSLDEKDSNGLLTLKIFKRRSLSLSEIIPVIENMGLSIKYSDGPFEIAPVGDSSEAVEKLYLHSFICCANRPLCGGLAAVKALFEDALGKVLLGSFENDGFNALTLAAGLTGREVFVMRAIARYMHQIRLPYGQESMVHTLLAHPAVTRDIVDLFLTRHDPDLKGDRAKAMAGLTQRIKAALNNISVLEEDRIFNHYLNITQASLRTNYFQKTPDGASKAYLAIKFDSRVIDDMPLPKPLLEIFVTSPRVDAIHLRGGKVARGGIRWSDRRDDYRSEILGLMKAQMVKNSVIVPVGSKGGFIVKHPPEGGYDKVQAEAVACYKIMMSGLLDLTDNRVGNKIVSPQRVVRHDNDDPYLVVAADKGTASFSDIANGISQDYGFWLDDAFASGGSVGYDHKQMGITARGVWESVKRHFRELGKDTQTEDFTAIGVGDLSGDVFGNGMLLSKHICLKGAFDHRHIFCDPTPDAASSYEERKRMFALPRSSWNDYDRRKLSKGGAIFSRAEKTLSLTPEIKKAFGITVDTLTPAELMTAMLKVETDLLYFGGIGTYIKASSETHAEVKDRANDAIRVNADEVRAKVIAEGANLGTTQRGRIVFAQRGGKLNTDAIDNSAGVSTSDHEVNIKILLRKLVMNGDLTLPARNKLLASMTDNVAALVLRINYQQTQALSVGEAQAIELLPAHARAMREMEKVGLLNRAVEFLPDTAEIAERQQKGQGLTRPELAVIMSYTKLWLYENLLASDLMDDPFLRQDLMTYFPTALQKKYEKDILQHQLRREIIATTLTNDFVNRVGISFVFSIMKRTGRSAVDVVRAYLLARGVFDLPALWADIEALDNKVPAQTQIDMLLTIKKALSSMVTWFLHHEGDAQQEGRGKSKESLDAIIARYRQAADKQIAWHLSKKTFANAQVEAAAKAFANAGVPNMIARRAAMMPLLVSAPDIARLADQIGCSMEVSCAIFFGLESRLGLTLVKERAEAMAGIEKSWQRESLTLLLEDMTSIHRALAQKVVGKSANAAKKAKDKAAAKDKISTTPVEDWSAANAKKLSPLDSLLREMQTAPSIDFAMLYLMARRLGDI